MLDVTFDELVSGCPQQLVACLGSFRHDEGHYVLQLITESISATQLIESGARPYATGQSLIKQPAVQHHVHGLIGSADLHSSQDVVPLAQHFTQDLIQVRSSVTTEQFTRAFFTFRFAQEKNDVHPSTRPQFEHRLQGGAGIQGSTYFAPERPIAFQCCRLVRRPISAKEFSAVCGVRRLPSTQVSKSDAAAEITIPGAAGKKGT